ncbi:glycine zipper 2TM domain-containing protein [Herbaspirillum sp.]|uniref:glycine zipper 2TM domain-containing protein n=1 Tax=Herbaspirillum sp. TaxID=1890675 RepID=UPI0031DB592E
MKNIIAACLLASSLAGCASWKEEPVYIAYGKIVAVQPRLVSVNRPNLASAAVGGLAGGVVGHQFGQGNGKTALTILGAVAGAAAGSQVGRHQELSQVFDLTVRTNNGGTTVVTTPEQGFIPGQQVRIVQQGERSEVAAIRE